MSVRSMKSFRILIRFIPAPLTIASPHEEEDQTPNTTAPMRRL